MTANQRWITGDGKVPCAQPKDGLPRHSAEHVVVERHSRASFLAMTGTGDKGTFFEYEHLSQPERYKKIVLPSPTIVIARSDARES